MRTLSGIVLLVLGSACDLDLLEGDGESDPDPLSASPATETADAVIVDGLPYDGCSYPVLIAGREYAPDASSQAMVAAFVQKVGENPGKIEYQLTGGTAEVECGWGSRLVLPEIRLLSIGAAAQTE